MKKIFFILCFYVFSPSISSCMALDLGIQSVNNLKTQSICDDISTQESTRIVQEEKNQILIRLVRKLVKPSSSGLREFRTQARIYSKIRVGNSY
jgi:hypothetical protein